MGIYNVSVTIVGIAPLLQHKFGAEATAEATAVKRQSGEKDYSEEWRDTVYTVDDVVCMPATWLEGALVRAAVNFKIRGKGKKTYKDLVRASVYVDPEMIPFMRDGEPIRIPEKPTHNPNESFYVDVRPVIVNRARVLRSRGAIGKGWKMGFNLQVIDDQLSADVLQQILEEAGRTVGVGDYRPRFGRFRVEEFKVV